MHSPESRIVSSAFCSPPGVGRFKLVGWLLLVVTLALSGCGGGSTEDDTGTPADGGGNGETDDSGTLPDHSSLLGVLPSAGQRLPASADSRYQFSFRSDSDGGVAEYRVSVVNDDTGATTGYDAVDARGTGDPSTYTVARILDLVPDTQYRWAVFAHDSHGRELNRSEYLLFDILAANDDGGVTAAYSSDARFLNRATFGTRPVETALLSISSPSQWFLDQLSTPSSAYLQPALTALRQGWYINSEMDRVYRPQANAFPFHQFWRNAINGADQLRQRMAFALSQILVISASDGGMLAKDPNAVAYYQQILSDHAFGNYRDLLEAVTYSPAMATYLTYLCNERGDPTTGRVPDENYARELMQLFTIGLVELNRDGTPVRDASGNPIPTYNNSDVTGLARVFTGLSPRAARFCGHETIAGVGVDDYALNEPLAVFANYHSTSPKIFLGLNIPSFTTAEQSISLALNHLFAHPNVAPFVSRQLIQRFTTSHPEPAYVARVAGAFENGNFRLPNGRTVGTARRGDLSATLAAVLFDPAAAAQSAASTSFGKLREPVLRLTQWARAFAYDTALPEWTPALWSTHSSSTLSQAPYKAPSVFNFYRPGYVLPQSETGSRGYTAPEMQLLNASSIPGYTNFLYAFISHNLDPTDTENIGLTTAIRARRFQPDYSRELALATTPSDLIDSLTNTLNYGALSASTRLRIIAAVAALPETWTRARTEVAILMLMTSTDYLIQR